MLKGLYEFEESSLFKIHGKELRSREKNSNRKELRSMMKPNGAENSEKTEKNYCFPNEELKDQVSRKSEEMETSLDTQIMQAIDTAIT